MSQSQCRSPRRGHAETLEHAGAVHAGYETELLLLLPSQGVVMMPRGPQKHLVHRYLPMLQSHQCLASHTAPSTSSTAGTPEDRLSIPGPAGHVCLTLQCVCWQTCEFTKVGTVRCLRLHAHDDVCQVHARHTQPLRRIDQAGLRLQPAGREQQGTAHQHSTADQATAGQSWVQVATNLGSW
jgi:hypothetical protein